MYIMTVQKQENTVLLMKTFNNTSSYLEVSCFTNITATHHILNDSQFPVNEVEYLLFSSIILPVTMHPFWEKHSRLKINTALSRT